MLHSSNIHDDLLVHLPCLVDDGWDILILTLLAGGTERHIAVTINISIVHNSAVDAAAVAKTITEVKCEDIQNYWKYFYLVFGDLMWWPGLKKLCLFVCFVFCEISEGVRGTFSKVDSASQIDFSISATFCST
jgi:hypothetical protein